MLLTTQLSLDTAVMSALQETEKGNRTSLDSISIEIDKLVAIAVKMLQGQLTGNESALNSRVSTPAGTNAPEKLYPSHEREGIVDVVPVAADQASRLRSVLLVLYSHRQRVVEMTRHKEDGGNGCLTSFLWQSKLHWTWSASEKTCHVTTLGARLSYGFHYVGSSSRVVLTPSTERALVFLLQAVDQRNHTMMTGPEVRSYS